MSPRSLDILCSFQIQCTRNQRSRQWITNFAVDSKHNLIGETGEWKNTYIALSWHLIPINDLLKTIFAIATDCLWHMLVYAGDRDISQPLQCSYLGLNYQIWRQTGNTCVIFIFKTKDDLKDAIFAARSCYTLYWSALNVFMLCILSWFSDQDKI